MDVPFTLADFVATDRRHARHFASLPVDASGDARAVHDALDLDPGAPTAHAPAVYLVDRNNTLRQVLVDEKLVRETRRCRDFWRGLQQRGGVLALGTAAAPAAPASPGVPPAPIAVDGPAAATAPAGPTAGDPYIETPRCTTCNECTRINPNMFAYDENKQAFIKDLDAGSYAQLVEAAESCQVSIIHPGHPRNPNEAGLAELVERAQPFL
jgi:ferredoxin